MKIYMLLIAALLVAFMGCAQQGPPIVGNDTDAHGCKISAGYSWCDAQQKCIRPFEENCTVACTMEAKICPDGSSVGRVGPDCEFAPCPQGNQTGPLVGNDTDAHGCKPSAGYSWCEAKQMCIRPFETPCEGSLKESDVRQIAQDACVSTGNLTGNVTYNANSRTYWIDLDTVLAGCAPACVVWEDNRSAEVNYRCTGLVEYTVKSENVSGEGEILVDGSGMTLYEFANDHANNSTCNGTCAETWPPLVSPANIVVPHGLPGTFGAIMRADGIVQVTYDQKPLYRYSGDSSPGDTKGNGIGGKWSVVSVG